MTGPGPTAPVDRAARDPRSGLVAAGVVVLVVLLILVGHAAAERFGAPPVSVAAARPTGQVWTMPAGQVQGFLAAHGVAATVPDDGTAGPRVVARVSWVPRATSSDTAYLLVLGDRAGGAGRVRYVFGAGAAAGTSTGSPFAALMQSRDWLRGNRAVDGGGGSWTDFSRVATVPAGTAREVWLVGHVVDVAASRPGAVVLSAAPRPVLGVALMVGDRIRWVRRVAG